MAEDNVVVAFQSLAKAIDDLIAEYGADRPDHQYQPLMLPMIDVKRIRAAIAAQAHEPSADVVERVQALQDYMEQHHGFSLAASEWDAAIAAMRPESERAGVTWHGPDIWPPELKRIVGEIRMFIAESERGDAHFLPPHHYAPLRPLVDQLSALGQEIVGAQPPVVSAQPSERAGIVAWLRNLPNDEWHPDHVADAIERGADRKGNGDAE